MARHGRADRARDGVRDARLDLQQGRPANFDRGQRRLSRPRERRLPRGRSRGTRARRGRERRPAAVTYDLRDAVDEIFGPRRRLQRVAARVPAAAARDARLPAVRGDRRTRSRARSTPASRRSSRAPTPRCRHGATVVAARGVACSRSTSLRAPPRGSPQRTRAALRRGRGRARRARAVTTVLHAPLRPIPKLLVLGAGARRGAARRDGRGARLVRHRGRPSARLRRARRLRACGAHAARRSRVARTRRCRSTEFDAIVVMSHHLATDRKYLAQLAPVATRLSRRARSARAARPVARRARRAGRRCSRAAAGARGPRSRRRFARVDRALDPRGAADDARRGQTVGASGSVGAELPATAGP